MSVGFPTLAITFATVKVLPEPVTPNNTCAGSPSSTPSVSCLMACGWSPVGLYFDVILKSIFFLITAIAAFQEFLDLYPDARLKQQATNRLFALQDLLVEKEYKSAKLYFDMGTYFGNCTSGGNNYEACIVTAQNALKDYPYSNRREEFASLIMKGKYELAKMSVEKKQLERYQDAEDECYGFINEYPDSKDRALAEKYIEKCKQYEKEHPESALDQLGNNAN